MQQNMNTSVKTFQILQEYLKDLEKEKTTIQTTYYKIKNLNTTLIAKIKNYREKIDTYNNRISFIKLLNHSSSTFIILHSLSFSNDLKKIENEYNQNTNFCKILKKKLSNILINITKTKLKLIIQS